MKNKLQSTGLPTILKWCVPMKLPSKLTWGKMKKQLTSTKSENPPHISFAGQNQVEMQDFCKSEGV